MVDVRAAWLEKKKVGRKVEQSVALKVLQ